MATDVGSLIPAVSLAGDEISIETAAVGELADSLSGQLFLQDDEGYTAAKQVWNAMFDHKKPSMVVVLQVVESNETWQTEFVLPT